MVVFLTNGVEWQGQRLIIDPAFQSNGFKKTLPSMRAADEQAVARLHPHVAQTTTMEIEAETSYAAANVIFRNFFSLPILDQIAALVSKQFRI